MNYSVRVVFTRFEKTSTKSLFLSLFPSFFFSFKQSSRERRELNEREKNSLSKNEKVGSRNGSREREVGNSAKLVILLLDYSLTKNRIIKIPGMEWRDKRGGE